MSQPDPERDGGATPKTDATADRLPIYGPPDSEWVNAEFARQLERELATANEALTMERKDAERYRWLQHQGCRAVHVSTDEDCYLMLCPSDLDAAIDTALAAEQEKKP